MPVNWTAATVAEAEYDVAATLVGFWSTALYGNAVQRRMLKTVRDPLATTYLARYRRRRPRARRRPAALLAAAPAPPGGGHRPRLRRGATGPWDTSAHAIPTCSLRDVDRRSARWRHLAVDGVRG